MNKFFQPYHLHFLRQSSEHVGVILKIREKFFSLHICCEFLLMDGLKQKTFSFMGYHQYGVLYLFQTWKIMRIQKPFSKGFCE